MDLYLLRPLSIPVPVENYVATTEGGSGFIGVIPPSIWEPEPPIIPPSSPPVPPPPPIATPEPGAGSFLILILALSAGWFVRTKMRSPDINPAKGEFKWTS